MTHVRNLVPRAILVALELFTGVGAVYGAVMLVRDAWHLPVGYLDPLPVHGWVLPGVALLLVVAVPMLGAAVLALLGRPRAADAGLTAGVLLVGWILIQLAVIGPRMALQAVMFVIGVAVAAVAWWWRTTSARARPGAPA
jgi:hypothetical protein